MPVAGPPVLWESMVFSPDAGEVPARYASRAAAEAGHRTLACQLFGEADAEPWETFVARVERLVAETEAPPDTPSQSLGEPT